MRIQPQRETFAFRLAMPTYYHYTEDPDFEPDPWREPNKYDETTPDGPGMFMVPKGPDESMWSHYGPHRAEFHSDEDLAHNEDVWQPRGESGQKYQMEMFVPSHVVDGMDYKGLSAH
jgi:hypothetical protein